MHLSSNWVTLLKKKENSNEPNKKIKKELAATIFAFFSSALALTSATYAYVSNNSVTANTTTISATTNGFILQQLYTIHLSFPPEKFPHLAAASTADCKIWWIPDQWSEGLSTVKTYIIPEDLNTLKFKFL
mgnify:CR=1 FL=1